MKQANDRHGVDGPLGLTVRGTGEASGEPDVAIVDVGVEVTARSARDARQQAAERAGVVLDAFRDGGVQPADFATVAVTLEPQYDHRGDTPRVTGYTVGNRWQVRIRDIYRSPGLIDDAIEDGGDAIRLYGVTLTVADPAGLQRLARQRAMENAHLIASELAASAGVTLGSVVSVSTVDEDPGRPVLYTKLAAAAATPIEHGLTGVSASVIVRYAIR